jgi:hypothetical protein
MVLRALARNLLYILLNHATFGASVGATQPTHLWSQGFGDASDQVAYSVAADASGNVIATGSFYGTVNFGGSDLTSTGPKDVFVVKFNSAGVHQWSQRFGDTAHSQWGMSVVADALGNVIATGDVKGTINFGGSDLIGEGGRDIFLAKFNSDGVHQWSQCFGDAGDQYGHSWR